jgi:hypothetical protein
MMTNRLLSCSKTDRNVANEAIYINDTFLKFWIFGALDEY